MPPPTGDGPDDAAARQGRALAVLAAMVRDHGLGNDTGCLSVNGDLVFSHVLEFGFTSLRRAELLKAVGAELEGVVPVDLEDMVYAFEPLPPPSADDAVRVRPIASGGMRVLAYAMATEAAQGLIEAAEEAGATPRHVLPVGGGAVRLVERVPRLAALAAGARRRRGRHRPRPHRRGGRARWPRGVQPQPQPWRPGGHRGHRPRVGPADGRRRARQARRRLRRVVSGAGAVGGVGAGPRGDHRRGRAAGARAQADPGGVPIAHRRRGRGAGARRRRPRLRGAGQLRERETSGCRPPCSTPPIARRWCRPRSSAASSPTSPRSRWPTPSTPPAVAPSSICAASWPTSSTCRSCRRCRSRWPAWR
ncbi:MAG: hypothetical protein R2939_18840 [Kofleriaceae bacterium]